MSGTRPKVLSMLLFCLLGVLAAVSFAQGIQNAKTRSSDFQWSGAHLLAGGVDPYRVMLDGNPENKLIMNQVPNYLHLLYVMLWPLGKLSFGDAKLVWAGLNTCFAALTILLLSLTYELRWSRALLLGFFLAASTPFRIAIGTGQMCLLELVLLTTALWAPKRAGVALGLSYFKYSFSPIVFFYAVLNRAWSQLAVSLAVVFIGLWVFCRLSGGKILNVALEPFRVSRSGVAIADADVVSLTKMLHPSWEPAAVLLGFVLSAVFAWFIFRTQSSLKDGAAALAPASLTLLPHGTYDFVILLIPAAFFLSLPLQSSRVRFGASAIALLWYVFRFLPTTKATMFWWLLRVALLSVVFFSVLEWPKRESRANLW